MDQKRNAVNMRPDDLSGFLYLLSKISDQIIFYNTDNPLKDNEEATLNIHSEKKTFFSLLIQVLATSI